MAKTCLPPSIHRCYANILQIADVALRVVFLLFLPCFELFFRLVLYTLETREMSAIFVFSSKTTQPGLLG